MTKDEIANIKRIDTSLNVFKRKIKALEAKKDKLIAPIVEEQMNLKAEIDFWERPVIDRYGKTTEELLREIGEQTAEEETEEESKETVPEEKAFIPDENVSAVSKDEIPAPTEEAASPEPEPAKLSEDLPDSEWPEEWN